ncbi:MAG: prepilin-type N-terminal cleavage/methylation domain-containing protein [Patescibacteria group bacterium]|jgi:Tfp pilus assembly protein PilW
MRIISRKKSGFTLIELLLYISMISVVVFIISSFMFLILQARIKNQTIAEVEQQGSQVMQIITQTIRNATGITAPSAIGIEATGATLTVPTPANSPTIFSRDNSTQQIIMKEGSAAAVALTNTRVTVNGLTFLNNSRSSTSRILQVSITLSAVNPNNRNEYEYSKTFISSAQLRP